MATVCGQGEEKGSGGREAGTERQVEGKAIQKSEVTEGGSGKKKMEDITKRKIRRNNP